MRTGRGQPRRILQVFMFSSSEYSSTSPPPSSLSSPVVVAAVMDWHPYLSDRRGHVTSRIEQCVATWRVGSGICPPRRRCHVASKVQQYAFCSFRPPPPPGVGVPPSSSSHFPPHPVVSSPPYPRLRMPAGWLPACWLPYISSSSSPSFFRSRFGSINVLWKWVHSAPQERWHNCGLWLP